MHVAIIGSGNVGGALAGAATAAGHSVTLAAADPQHAAEVAGRAGANAASSNADAVRDADVVVLAIPGLAVPAVADELRDALQGKVVIDSTNPLNESFSDTTTTDRSAAEELQERIPGVPVVKAFNTIFASRHGNPTESGQPLDAYIAGDDADAKGKASELAGSLGYRVIDAGSLRMARALEEMAFLNISLNAGNSWTWQSGWKLVGPTDAQ
ncbi:NAD(P)-binding domain-containing protein [Intrasporangium calvum]|uniref:NAD(P)-binding domain-containing protein n=1 Tax=Intrasporangium calvum TaxID=53358 RepID=A0ABT5GH52_9MICO|nr:NAD(P)-binding domain-containing protein [Intrasporangium calvum]MDC5697588.1 NAD(P)-binding domain-containing protein [Intrasporangium calvum]